VILLLFIGAAVFLYKSQARSGLPSPAPAATVQLAGFPCYPCLVQDRLLDPVRRHPEFTALLDRLRQRYEQDIARYRIGT
jgi:hypothetical protein